MSKTLRLLTLGMFALLGHAAAASAAQASVAGTWVSYFKIDGTEDLGEHSLNLKSDGTFEYSEKRSMKQTKPTVYKGTYREDDVMIVLNIGGRQIKGFRYSSGAVAALEIALKDRNLRFHLTGGREIPLTEWYATKPENSLQRPLAEVSDFRVLSTKRQGDDYLIRIQFQIRNAMCDPCLATFALDSEEAGTDPAYFDGGYRPYLLDMIRFEPEFDQTPSQTVEMTVRLNTNVVRNWYGKDGKMIYLQVNIFHWSISHDPCFGKMVQIPISRY